MDNKDQTIKPPVNYLRGVLFSVILSDELAAIDDEGPEMLIKQVDLFEAAILDYIEKRETLDVNKKFAERLKKRIEDSRPKPKAAGAINKPEPTPEEGKDFEYYYLKPGEVIQPGDEFKYGNEWLVTGRPGTIWEAADRIYRRKIHKPVSNAPEFMIEAETMIEGDYEYIILCPGAPVQQGDEYLVNNEWRIAVSRFGEAQDPQYKYRRPVYRFLKEGEIIEEGDLIKRSTGWVTLTATGSRAIGEGLLSENIGYFKRPIKKGGEA